MIKLSRTELGWIAGALKEKSAEAASINHPLSQLQAENLRSTYDKIVQAIEQDAKRIEVGT